MLYQLDLNYLLKMVHVASNKKVSELGGREILGGVVRRETMKKIRIYDFFNKINT